jgi:GNAT superfamily N-acetyltransferase
VPTATLDDLYVVPERRGRGLGRALLRAALDAARERGAASFELYTGEATRRPAASTRRTD